MGGGRGKGQKGEARGRGRAAGSGRERSRSARGAAQGQSESSAIAAVKMVDFTLACPCQDDPNHEANKAQVRQLDAFLKDRAPCYVFQQERGEGGHLHLQGRSSLFSRTRPVTMYKQYEEVGVVDKVGGGRLSIKFSATSSLTTARADFSYVMKSETRVKGPWSNRASEVPWQIRKIVEMGLFPWQQDVENSHLYPDPRFVNVLVNKPGNMGKSTYCSWLVHTERGVVIPPFSCAEQLNHAAYALLKGKKRTKVIVDIPRALTQIPTYKRKANAPPPFFIQKKLDVLSGIFLAIEQIKNGLLCDPRHQFRQVLVPSPTIWVFMNEHPDLSLLSIDRWKINHEDPDDPRKLFNANSVPKYPPRDGPVPEDQYDAWDSVDPRGGELLQRAVSLREVVPVAGDEEIPSDDEVEAAPFSPVGIDGPA